MSQISQRERITQYIRETYGTEAEYLWADSPGSAVFRHPASKKNGMPSLWMYPPTSSVSQVRTLLM